MSDSIEAILGEVQTIDVVIYFNRSLSSILWEFEGSIINSSDNTIFILNPPLPASIGPVFSTLSIPSIMYEDAGLYTVTASNIDGNSTVSFMVTVVGKWLTKDCCIADN